MRNKSVGVVAFLLLCSAFPTTAFAADPPEALSSIPSDYAFVIGINVQSLTRSSFFARLQQEQPQTGQITGAFARLAEMTGLDPARDISHMFLAMRSGEKSERLAVLTGKLERARIASFIRSKTSPIEMEYAGASLLLIPKPTDNGVQKGVAFIGGSDIMVGDADSLKEALDARAGGKKNILSDGSLAPLLKAIDYDQMFWFAGDVTSVLQRSPFSPNLIPNAAAIQSFFGSYSIADDIVGTITANLINPDSARMLANAFDRVISMGQSFDSRNPDGKTMFENIKVSQMASQVTLSFKIPFDLIQQAELARQMGRSAGGVPVPRPSMPKGVVNPSASGVTPPVALETPLPYYTDEARQNRIEGIVLVQLVVRKDGTVDSFKVLRGLGYGLDESAINMIKSRWRFQPGTYNGIPADVQINVEVSFRLFRRPEDMRRMPVR